MRSFMRRISLGAPVLVALSAMTLPVQAADPLIGTWELNLAKSKYSPGPAPKSQTRTYAAAGDAVRLTANGVDAEGKATLVEYTASYDGKDYPITGAPDADAISLKRIDDHTSEATQKKAGKVVLTVKRVVSKDGKVLTTTATGTNAKGQALHNVVVFDRK
jgi:hypothetical protein